MRCRSEYSAALDGREAAVLLQRRGWLWAARSATVAGPKKPEAQVSAVAVKTRLLRILEGAAAAAGSGYTVPLRNTWQVVRQRAPGVEGKKEISFFAKYASSTSTQGVWQPSWLCVL